MNTVNARLAVITARNPDVLTKSFHLDPDGNLVKTPGGPLVDGLAEIKSFTGLDDLAALVSGLKPNQAFCHGLPRHERARVVTGKALTAEKTKSNGGLPVIARDREHFSYAPAPGTMLFDFDGFEARHADEIRKLLIDLHPDLADAPMMITASASSGLYHGRECLRGLNGWRALVIVADASDAPRAGDALFKTSWLKGKGFIRISKSGAQLPRGPLDGCVWTPERLDFISGANCKPPLEQHRPDVALYNRTAEPFDTRKIKSLTPAEMLEYERLVDEAKRDTAAEAKETRARWIETRIEDEIKKRPDATDEEKEKIRDTWRRASDHRILHADFELETLDGGTVTVEEILSNRDRWHLAYIKDPLEPDGENSRACLHLLTAGKPYVWSFFQGLRFTLTLTRKKYQITPGGRCDTVDGLLRTAREDGTLFLRGGDIVTTTDKGDLLPLDALALQYKLDGLAMFQKFDARANAPKPADCPRSLADGLAVAARMDGGLPELKGIITHPTLDPETGRIIDRDGFDAGTGLLLRLGFEDWPNIPAKPNPDTTRRAADLLLKPFRFFPFAGPVDKGVFLAAILTAVIRPLLDTAPLFMITAPSPATGKSLLARCLARIIGLSQPAVFPSGGDEDEIRKRLLSIFRQGARLVVMDNITGTLQSDSLCAALTSPFFEDRVLGASNIIKAPTNALFLATGNNIRPTGDLTRRTVICRLDAQEEKPWTRTFDENVIEYIDRHRPELITAALVVLKGTFENGFKVADGLGSFEDWNTTARAAVCYLNEIGLADVMDPALSIEQSYAEDPETGKLRSLLTAWHGVFFDTAATVAEALHRAETNSDLWDACEEIAGDKGYLNARRLGRWIERHRDRIIDGKAFELAHKATGKNHWRVRMLDWL